ncbi:hypothetical protein [Pseudomarimonas arenosa]|uniref:Uncharacterized protein n=1 Tax=Pseudomarimonas arenosa TaxID=2774145 RepID=A0AAW3ZP72_9GAMM|nr:hypothetical protein [Pseudomarimonas arenosa]MBD8526136.1 hypothetical protein [Pseudomarimonas arenosa]
MFEFSRPPHEPRLPLSAALRQLAEQPAPFDDWPQLSARLRSEAHSHQSRWPSLALAASLLIGITLALLLQPTPQVSAPQATAVEPPALEALQAESAWLENWLRQQRQLKRATAVLDAERLSARQELIDQLQFVDLLLAEEPVADTELALWQQRVLLLRQLSVEYSALGPALSAAALVNGPLLL